jgi:hypothetical protein
MATASTSEIEETSVPRASPQIHIDHGNTNYGMGGEDGSVASRFCSQRNKILQARLEKRETITIYIATGTKDRIAPRQFNSVPNTTATLCSLPDELRRQCMSLQGPIGTCAQAHMDKSRE